MKFAKNKQAMAGLFFLLLLSVLAILGYQITPEKTPYANNQQVSLAARPPGFKVQLLRVKLSVPIAVSKLGFIEKMLYGQAKQYIEVPVEWACIQEDSVTFVPYGEVLQPVLHALPKGDVLLLQTKTFWLGTDRFGRDLLSRLIIAARVSLSVGLVAVVISLFMGLSLGALAGYFGGWIDKLIVWFTSIVWSIPTLFMVIVITMALGKGFWQVFVAIGFTMWVDIARLVRGQVLGIRQKEYVEAAKALSYSHRRIIWRHILPGIIGPVIVVSTSNFASAILIEAGLNFLGIGAQPPVPSWGSMIKEHYAYILLDANHLALAPGGMIVLTVLAFTFVGNGLRNAMDTHLG